MKSYPIYSNLPVKYHLAPVASLGMTLGSGWCHAKPEICPTWTEAPDTLSVRPEREASFLERGIFSRASIYVLEGSWWEIVTDAVCALRGEKSRVPRLSYRR